MTAKDYLLVLLPLLTAVITAGVTHFLTVRRDIQQQMRQEKVRRYEQLIQAVKNGFLGSSGSPAQQEAAKQEFYTHAHLVWLYGSDQVIQMMNEFVMAFTTGDESDHLAYSKACNTAFQRFVHAMRIDVRGETSLEAKELVTVTPPPG